MDAVAFVLYFYATAWQRGDNLAKLGAKPKVFFK